MQDQLSTTRDPVSIAIRVVHYNTAKLIRMSNGQMARDRALQIDAMIELAEVLGLADTLLEELQVQHQELEAILSPKDTSCNTSTELSIAHR
ncbi:MAG: hypothetical protein JNM52_08405 [Betaproteobacteria bacterium]|nr:hypothetical protein [Betaproteobacteria bacterium]